MYFPDWDEATCTTLPVIKDIMKYDGIEKAVLTLAKLDKTPGYAWCKQFHDMVETGQGNCGKLCEKYSPRNGKNGRCRFSGHFYVEADVKRVIKIKL